MHEPDKAVRKIAILAFCLVMAASVLSCSSLGGGGEDKDKEGLANAVESYNRTFRWEDYTAAVGWVPANRKELFWKEVADFQGKVRIIDFEVRDLDIVPKFLTGTAILYLRYYRTDSPTLQTVTFSQRWYFSEKLKHWQMDHSGYEAISKKSTGF